MHYYGVGELFTKKIYSSVSSFILVWEMNLLNKIEEAFTAGKSDLLKWYALKN